MAELDLTQLTRFLFAVLTLAGAEVVREALQGQVLQLACVAWRAMRTTSLHDMHAPIAAVLHKHCYSSHSSLLYP